MKSLEETIKDFQAYVLEKDNKIDQEVVGPDQDFKDTRLSIYQDAYSLRLIEGLSRDFPAFKKLIGEDLFEELAQNYIRNFPPTHFSIRYAGQHFPRFLNTIKANPLWSELTAFEWALENTIDAKDAPQLTFEEMAQVNPESWGELKFTTHPSLQILPLCYPVPSLWQHLVQAKEKPQINRQSKPVHWFVWRFNRQGYFRPTDENQFWMIQAIQAGNTFSEVCTALCESLGEDRVIPFVAETLRSWIEEGVFSEFHIGEA